MRAYFIRFELHLLRIVHVCNSRPVPNIGAHCPNMLREVRISDGIDVDTGKVGIGAVPRDRASKWII